MTERSIDELGPVDYLVVEFPPDSSTFTGEGAKELLRLHDAGIIRVMDIVIIAKAEDGTVMAQELGDLGEMDELSRLETELAETLAADESSISPRPCSPVHWRVFSYTRTCGPRSSHPRSGATVVR